MTNEQYYLQYSKWRDAYDIKAFRIFRKALNQSFASMPIDNITFENYKIIIKLNIQQLPIQLAYFEVYRTIGLTHGKRVGNGINREIKRFNNDLFSREFLDSIVEWVRGNVASRIVSVSDTMAKRIERLVEVSIEQGFSVLEMQKYLTKTLGSPSFTKFQALRISRTEVTTATNHAANEAGVNAGIVLEKLWISAIDGRTRRKPRDQFDHFHMDGQTVGQFEKFVLRSKNGVVDNIDYPGDPKGSAADTIQCRCVHAFRPIRDEQGFVVVR
ncbi:MAG: hypothetical protein [Bacteriophage sp.]|nr:MAG: hypothetical protein [Bacteriophage sp.]